MTIDGKVLYERLDALSAALPEMHRDEFVQTISELTVYYTSPAERVRVFQTVEMWRQDHGYGRFKG